METVMLPDVTHDCFSKNERKMLHQSDNNSNNNIKDDLSTNSFHGDVVANESPSAPAVEKDKTTIPPFISLMKDVQQPPMSLTDREDLLTLAQHKFDEIRRGSKGFSLFSNRKSVPSTTSSSEPLPRSVQILSTLLYLSLMMHKVEDIKQILMQSDPKSYHEWQNLFDVLHSPVFFANERCIQNTRVKKIFKRKQTYKHKLIETEKKLIHQKELTNKIQAHANETTNQMSESIQKLTEEAAKTKDVLDEKQKVEMKLLLASKEIELLRSNVASLDAEIARSNVQLCETRNVIKAMEVERGQHLKEIEILREQEKKLEGVVIGLTKEVDDKRVKVDSLTEKLSSAKIIHEDATSKWNEKYVRAKEESAAVGIELKSTKEALVRRQTELKETKDELLACQKKIENTTMEMHEKSLSVKESTAITETELRFTKQSLEEARQDLNHTKEALAIAVKALAESREADLKETLRLKELLSSSKSELDHLNEKLKDSEIKANDLSYSKQSLREEHEHKCIELRNAVTKLEADLKETTERAKQAEDALDYSSTLSKLVDEKSAYSKENEKLKEEMGQKNYELTQLNGKLEFAEKKVIDAMKKIEEQSNLNDKKCNQLKNVLAKLEDEVKIHSNRAQKAEENVDLVSILKALVEEKALELRSRDKLNDLLHSNSCEVNKLNERLKDSSIKVNDLANDKKLTAIHHQRECIDLREKVSRLESEVTNSSNRVKLAEEKLNVAKSLSTLVEERNKEVEANEKLKEMIHTNQCELIQYRERLKQSEAKIEALTNDKASTKELHNKECLEMNDRMQKLQNEIETCTNRATKAEENLNLSNALSSLIEDKISDTKANETMLELLNSNKNELFQISQKLKETELNINIMVNEKMMNSFEKLKESELKFNDLRRDSKSADELYQKQCKELNDKILELQTEVAAYSERAQNAEKNLNLANSIAELIEERNTSSASFQNITKLLNENKSDLAELNENILGTENKISTLIDEKMVYSNEKLDDSLATVTKLEAEKKVYKETHERERNEQKSQILDLQREIIAQKAEDNTRMTNAFKTLTENKDLNLKQHEEVTKLLESNKEDLNILKDQCKQSDSKLAKINNTENEIRDIIKDKMVHSNKKLLETEMNMKALIADKQLNETIHEMECNEMTNRLVQLENVVAIYKSRALKAEDNLNLANILTALAEQKNTDQKYEDSIDELLEFNKRALLAFNENLQELDSKVDALVESRETEKKSELKDKNESTSLAEETLLNFQSELDALKSKALHAEETLKVVNSYASFTEAVDVKYDKLSKLLESNKEELNRLNQNLLGTDSKISQLLTSSNMKEESNDNISIAEKLSNIESLLEASSLNSSKKLKETKNNMKSRHSAPAVTSPSDQKSNTNDDCLSAITSENFEFYISKEGDQNSNDGDNLNNLEKSFDVAEDTKNLSTASIAKDTSNTSISSKNFEGETKLSFENEIQFTNEEINLDSNVAISEASEDVSKNDHKFSTSESNEDARKIADEVDEKPSSSEETSPKGVEDEPDDNEKTSSRSDEQIVVSVEDSKPDLDRKIADEVDEKTCSSEEKSSEGVEDEPDDNEKTSSRSDEQIVVSVTDSKPDLDENSMEEVTLESGATGNHDEEIHDTSKSFEDSHQEIEVQNAEDEAVLSNSTSVTPPNSEVEDNAMNDEASVDEDNSSLTHRDIAVEVVSEAVETATSNVASRNESQ